MDYLSEHLTSLRREIIDLQETNLRYARQREHTPADRSASDERKSRLIAIKQELSNMMNCPPDRTVWWERLRKSERGV